MIDVFRRAKFEMKKMETDFDIDRIQEDLRQIYLNLDWQIKFETNSGRGRF